MAQELKARRSCVTDVSLAAEAATSGSTTVDAASTACAEEEAVAGFSHAASAEDAVAGGPLPACGAAESAAAETATADCDPLHNFAIWVAYNGEPFSGFARQPGQLTVQGSIEEALELLFRRPVETVCAGRTDSGVHARGQVVNFQVSESELRGRTPFKLQRSLNALTHDDISIKEMREMPAEFSSRFSATMREYHYFICTDAFAPLLMRNFCWHIPKQLDVEAMRKAASYLIGEHDFKSFCMAVSAEGKSTNRNVFSITVEPEQIWGENLVVITVKGNAFLHSMVRTIVGTLVAVGLGRRKPEWVQEVLEARNRLAAGENAPAQGLVFWEVSYEGERVHTPSL